MAVTTELSGPIRSGEESRHGRLLLLCLVLYLSDLFFFFFHSDKIADRDNLRGKGFILAQFQRFQSIVLGSVVSWPVGRQNIMAAGI
jgi:hypothetical protein